MGDAMKRILLAGATLLALATAQPTLAADAPVYRKGPAPVAAAFFNWTGFYIGAQGGYAWGSSRHTDGSAATTGDFNLTGGLFGLTVGANWQTGNLVLGVEGDYSWARISGSTPTVVGFGCAGTCNTDIWGVGTLRGRVGWAFDRVLPFVTAGVAWSNVHGSIGTPVLQESTTTLASWTAGAGVEVAVMQNLSVKVEWLYVASPGGFIYAPAFCVAPGCAAQTNAYNIVRVGANWRF